MNGKPKWWDDFTSEQADVLSKGATKVLRDVLGEEFEATEYLPRRDELIDMLQATPGLEPTMTRKATAACLDWTVARWTMYGAECERYNRITTRRGELLEAMLPIYLEAQEFTDVTLEDVHRLDLLLLEYDRLGLGKDPARLFEPTDPDLVTMLELLRWLRDEMRPVLALAAAERREAERAERIAAHRSANVVMHDRKCVRCQRKPARIDDLCKRCARETGVIVHGKIGAA